MTFTYTPGTPNDITRVRFSIGDTVEDTAILSDEEITFAVTEQGSWQGAVIACIRFIITKLSEPDFQADWLRVSASEARKSWERMLAEKKDEFGLGRSVSSSAVATYRVDSNQTEADYE